jgi:hypothetical protein
MVPSEESPLDLHSMLFYLPIPWPMPNVGKEEKCKCKADSSGLEELSPHEAFEALDPLVRPRGESLQNSIENLHKKGFTVCRRKSN